MTKKKMNRVIIGIVAVIIIALVIFFTSSKKIGPGAHNLATAFEIMVTDINHAISIDRIRRNNIVISKISYPPVISPNFPNAKAAVEKVDYTLAGETLFRNGEGICDDISAFLITSYLEDGKTLTDDTGETICLSVEMMGNQNMENILLSTRIWPRLIRANQLFDGYFSFIRDNVPER